MTPLQVQIKKLLAEGQTRLADLQALYMALEKRPKWTFWLLFTSKADELAELRFLMKITEEHIERLRMLFYTADESYYAPHKATTEN